MIAKYSFWFKLFVPMSQTNLLHMGDGIGHAREGGIAAVSIDSQDFPEVSVEVTSGKCGFSTQGIPVQVIWSESLLETCLTEVDICHMSLNDDDCRHFNVILGTKGNGQ